MREIVNHMTLTITINNASFYTVRIINSILTHAYRHCYAHYSDASTIENNEHDIQKLKPEHHTVPLPAYFNLLVGINQPN